MALDVTTPESVGWWLVRLVTRLQSERGDLDRLDQLFQGNHPLPETDQEATERFRAFQKICRSNYLSLVVEAALERMKVTGFRAGPDDPQGDSESWELWQRARLDADQVLVHRTMLALRRAYVIVGPHPRKRDRVLVTPEDPRQVITESYPDDRREVRAALKLYDDNVTGRVTAYLYLPRYVYKFRAPSSAFRNPNDPTFYTADAISRWEVVSQVRNPTAPEVPVVEFANRPSLLGRAVSEFEDVIDIQNRINQTLLHRLVAEKFASFRQTAILNLAFEEDEEGNPVAPDLPSDPGIAWLLQGENLAMWQSQQTSTADILSGVEADIRDLAAITRTPPHYLLNSIVNASGDALKSAETGLVAKVREHISQASESWEQVIHLAHRVSGTDRDVDALEAVWADPESRSLAELYDAASKAVVAGEPWRKRMELLGHTPPEIDRMEAERTQDALLAAMAAPQPAPAPAATPPAPGAPGAAESPEEAAA